mmetsp:Transcript_40549/g.89000  ORF Transcript_40549/g.89000 Transcript_40549/m.89000 type:complete len:214 (-) Transcript_40549:456-1097(-)
MANAASRTAGRHADGAGRSGGSAAALASGGASTTCRRLGVGRPHLYFCASRHGQRLLNLVGRHLCAVQQDTRRRTGERRHSRCFAGRRLQHAARCLQPAGRRMYTARRLRLHEPRLLARTRGRHGAAQAAALPVRDRRLGAAARPSFTVGRRRAVIHTSCGAKGSGRALLPLLTSLSDWHIILLIDLSPPAAAARASMFLESWQEGISRVCER